MRGSASRDGVKPPFLRGGEIAQFGEAEPLRERLEVDVVAGLGTAEEGESLVVTASSGSARMSPSSVHIEAMRR